MTFPNSDALVKNMNSYFISRNDRIARLGMTINTFQNIPGLVGFWPMSSVQRSTGNAFDLSSQTRTLTFNGNPTYNIHNDFMPYIALDGAGDFLSRADETDLDILGTETIYNSSVRGLTLGGWFFVDTIGGGSVQLIGKSNPTGNQQSYQIIYNPGNTITNRVSIDGSVLTDVTAAGTTGNWLFVVGRFVPSTELSIFINGTQTINTTSIPASIFNSSSSFEIGSFGGGNFLNGRASLCFLSANILANAYINALFQQSRILFGV